MAKEDLKLILHNMAGVKRPDDPSYPFKLEVLLRVPSFMEVAAVFLYGNEHIIVRSKTREALEEFAKKNELKTHPRLIKFEITKPEVTKAPKPEATPAREFVAIAMPSAMLSTGGFPTVDDYPYNCSKNSMKQRHPH